MFEEPATRTVGASVAEVLKMLGGGVLFAFSVIYWSARPSRDQVVNEFVHAGSVIAENIWWSIGTFMTVLLAFYAASLGRQFLHESSQRLRRGLGFVSELIAVTLITQLLLIAVYCTQNPDEWALMLVLLPVLGVVLFLAVNLGTFVILPASERRAAALRTATGAQSRIDRLTPRSTRNPLAVIAMNAVICFTLGLVPTAVLLPHAVPDLAVFIALETILCVVAGAVLAHTWLSTSDLLARYAGTAPFATIYGGFGWFLVSTEFGFAAPTPAYWMSILTVMLLTTAATFWPLRRARTWLTDWTVRSAANSTAILVLMRTDRRARTVVDSIPPPTIEKSKVSLRARLRALFAAR